ncbi:hypothetical protein C3941_12845 [Kaistia algarum]|uniref:Imm50 family immunity protein n=1 Tax=Kaistia algarum TaxID=2083279 RepID=UPI000CE8680D|nr:Imm50 family immunity protein [Kaistia algarum]MCX5515240.1 Imm50 family immunity protein [Kaistia algarum]PPE80021.1 hypothetical protein C3941_12845 [Kaistia algarum]
MSETVDVPGWSNLVAWFGGRPTFHDAEVISLDLRRDPEESVLRVHTWQMTSDLDERGYFILDRHVIVRFILAGISALELSEWSAQNVIFGLALSRDERGYRIELHSIFGIGGVIIANSLRVDHEAIDGAQAVGG